MQRVYVVDDDKNIVESISIVLESHGYEVSSQNDGVDLIKNTAEFDPDLVILDVMFPEDQGAGFEMARQLKHDDKTQDIPLLMLSAINEKGSYAGTFTNRDRDDIFLPVQEFVEKPIDPESLIKKVKTLIKS